jgi:adenine phosphoribosyltransferase
MGIESRGFIFGVGVADRLGCGFVPVRKPGKLPLPTFVASYELEYGTDELHVHRAAVAAGSRVLIVDDLIETGGTAAAAIDLVGQLNAEVVAISVLIELTALAGRNKVAPASLMSVLAF